MEQGAKGPRFRDQRSRWREQSLQSDNFDATAAAAAAAAISTAFTAYPHNQVESGWIRDRDQFGDDPVKGVTGDIAIDQGRTDRRGHTRFQTCWAVREVFEIGPCSFYR